MRIPVMILQNGENFGLRQYKIAFNRGKDTDR